MYEEKWEFTKLMFTLFVILAALFAWSKIVQSMKDNSKSNRGIEVVGETLPY